MSVSRPYIDLETQVTAAELAFFSDASLNPKFGIGARVDKEWLYGQWPEGFILGKKPSIEYAELFALVIAVFVWAPKLKNHRVIIFCDNESMVSMVNKTTSSCKNCMILIRKLVLKCLQFNFRLFGRHLVGALNEVADSLSRLDFKHFDKLAHELHLKNMPQDLPMDLWPVTKVWMD